MFVIEEAKFPPPSPPIAATTTNTQNGVPGWMTIAARIARDQQQRSR